MLGAPGRMKEEAHEDWTAAQKNAELKYIE